MLVRALCSRSDVEALALEDVPVRRDVARRVVRHRGVHACGDCSKELVHGVLDSEEKLRGGDEAREVVVT